VQRGTLHRESLEISASLRSLLLHDSDRASQLHLDYAWNTLGVYTAHERMTTVCIVLGPSRNLKRNIIPCGYRRFRGSRKISRGHERQCLFRVSSIFGWASPPNEHRQPLSGLTLPRDLLTLNPTLLFPIIHLRAHKSPAPSLGNFKFSVCVSQPLSAIVRYIVRTLYQ
jgi:hypothetical protein